ncbi:MAG: hypothetical protein QXZ44_06045 [Ferroplasma sp.]
MTILNKNDYEKFTWKYRKPLFVSGIIIIIARISITYTGLQINFILNDILSLLTIGAFLAVVEILLLRNYEKSIKNN